MYNLKEISTRAPEDLNKSDIKKETKGLIKKLTDLQNLLYAESKHSVLVILQGMDASGKDGAVRKVLGRLNPQGVVVASFKKPTELELSHDFLWRIHQNVPAKGMIQVFNRSHYEDVLVTRVNGIIDDETAKQRFEDINNFEKLLITQAGTIIFKFYLHISEEEQKERLQERIDNPKKHWKFDQADFEKAKEWKAYHKYYEKVFENCNKVPWEIVPADQNWYKEYFIAKTLVKRLENLNMQYPSLPQIINS